MKTEALDRELIWQPDGHVSDLVVSMLADAQSSLLPATAILHVDECGLCTDRMVGMAVLSLGVAADLGALPELARRAPGLVPAVHLMRPVTRMPVSHDFPRHFFLVALALAVLGALPALGAFKNLAGFISATGANLLAVIHGTRLVGDVLAHRMENLLLLASFLASLACVTAGWLVARTWPAAPLEGNLG